MSSKNTVLRLCAEKKKKNVGEGLSRSSDFCRLVAMATRQSLLSE